jgi:hypothetical protein
MILRDKFCTPHSSPFQAVVHAALHQSKKKRLGTSAIRGFRDVLVRLPVQLCTVSRYYPAALRAVSREWIPDVILLVGRARGELGKSEDSKMHDSDISNPKFKISNPRAAIRVSEK